MKDLQMKSVLIEIEPTQLITGEVVNIANDANFQSAILDLEKSRRLEKNVEKLALATLYAKNDLNEVERVLLKGIIDDNANQVDLNKWLESYIEEKADKIAEDLMTTDSH